MSELEGGGNGGETKTRAACKINIKKRIHMAAGRLRYERGLAAAAGSICHVRELDLTGLETLL
jgi:hypothetical protein